MDPELTEAEKEALNKIVDDVQKLNQQLQRFLKSMAESSRIQTAYKAPSMEERLERIKERLAKMMATQKSESDVDACVAIPEVAACGWDDPCDVEVKPIDSETSSQHHGIMYSSKSNNLIKSEVVVAASCKEIEKSDLVVDDQVSLLLSSDSILIEDAPKPTEYFTINYSSDLSNNEVVMEVDETPELEISFSYSNLNLNSCSPSVCINASEDWPSYLTMQTDFHSYNLLPRLKVRCVKPPAKPPDDIFTGVPKTDIVWFDVGTHIISYRRNAHKVFHMLFRVYAESKMFDKRVEGFDYMVENGTEIDERACMVLLLALTRADQVDMSLKLFRRMVDANVPITVYSMTIAVDGLGRKGETDPARVLNDAEISKGSFETEFCDVKYTLSSNHLYPKVESGIGGLREWFTLRRVTGLTGTVKMTGRLKWHV